MVPDVHEAVETHAAALGDTLHLGLDGVSMPRMQQGPSALGEFGSEDDVEWELGAVRAVRLTFATTDVAAVVASFGKLQGGQEGELVGAHLKSHLTQNSRGAMVF